jgi:hypothetical protein
VRHSGARRRISDFDDMPSAGQAWIAAEKRARRFTLMDADRERLEAEMGDTGSEVAGVRK